MKITALYKNNRLTKLFSVTALSFVFSCVAEAGPAAENLPEDTLLSDRPMDYPVANISFLPGNDAMKADELHAKIKIIQTTLSLDQELSQPICNGLKVKQGGSCRGGSDKRLFPEITLEFFTFKDNTMLASVQSGTMVAEDESRSNKRSYWHAIPQYGKVWKEPGDSDWSRASFPIMLVNHVENMAHQGVATFLYKDNNVSNLRIQFIQQSTPWNTPEHFLAWGIAKMKVLDSNLSGLAEKQDTAVQEISHRMEMQPWSELERQYAAGALKGFGGPLSEKWIVMKAVGKDGKIYYQDSKTAFGAFPYPEEMRFGIRSMTKSISVPLALARLAKAYGPYILNLKIGEYVEGLHPGYNDVRFIDAANMATGMGGAGSFITYPNDDQSGYVDATYDDWYNGAKSAQEKIEFINRDTGPYPWGPGVVNRYRDRDYHLLGSALDSFLKEMRGPEADIWKMLEEEVFLPIGIYHAPIVKTVESDGSTGLAWFHAGFYPTLDDLAKIGQLYQNLGHHKGDQILHPEVTAQIFTTQGAFIKNRDHSLEKAFSMGLNNDSEKNQELYKMGFHYVPYTDKNGNQSHVPMMSGFSGNQVIFHPNDIISIRLAKAWPLPDDESAAMGPEKTIEIINSLPR